MWVSVLSLAGKSLLPLLAELHEAGTCLLFIAAYIGTMGGRGAGWASMLWLRVLTLILQCTRGQHWRGGTTQGCHLLWLIQPQLGPALHLF